MYITNIPTVLSSLTFLLPFYAAVDTGNAITAFCWGALATTSVLLHTTKRPYHIHGDGNCIPALQFADTIAVYVAIVRAQIDGYYAGPAGLFVSIGIVLWGTILFHIGRPLGMFAFDRRADIAIVSHVSLHLLSSFGGSGVIYLRALKNGLGKSTV
jgi:hypothetical protein